MAFLSHRCVADEAGTCFEELSFFGTSLEEVDQEMRQWLLRTIPLGSCHLSIGTIYTTDGQQHHMTLSYTCRQPTEGRIEPKGIFWAGV